jgi:hypothetical protein
VKGYLVDTNIPSELTRQQPDTRVADFIRKAGRENLFLSVMTIDEICKGIVAMPLWPWLSGSKFFRRGRPTFMKSSKNRLRADPTSVSEHHIFQTLHLGQ